MLPVQARDWWSDEHTRSKKFFRGLTDEELVQIREYPFIGFQGVNAGRAAREWRRRNARKAD